MGQTCKYMHVYINQYRSACHGTNMHACTHAMIKTINHACAA